MKLPANLRLALVPIGLLIATKGLSYLSDEHDRLSEEIDRQRAELAAADPTAPEDLPSSSVLEYGPGGKFAADKPKRRRSRAGTIAAAAAGFAAGAYLAMRTQEWLRERAAAELAAELPEPAPGTCGVYPAFGEPPTPCTLPPHESFRHSWEGGHGDLIPPAPAPVDPDPLRGDVNY